MIFVSRLLGPRGCGPDHTVLEYEIGLGPDHTVLDGHPAPLPGSTRPTAVADLYSAVILFQV